MKTDAKQYHYLVTALEFHRGTLSKEQFPAYGVNPMGNLKGHISIHSAIEKLTSLQLVYDDGIEITVNPQRTRIVANKRQAAAVQLVKDMLLLQFNDWSRKLSLTSYDSSFYEQFGNFCFAFVAPSYVSTITTWSNEGNLKPGFVVADILILNINGAGKTCPLKRYWYTHARNKPASRH